MGEYLRLSRSCKHLPGAGLNFFGAESRLFLRCRCLPPGGGTGSRQYQGEGDQHMLLTAAVYLNTASLSGAC